MKKTKTSSVPPKGTKSRKNSPSAHGKPRSAKSGNGRKYRG